MRLLKLRKELASVTLLEHVFFSFQSPHSHIPYGADGSGYYSSSAIICYNEIKEAIPLVLDAIKSATVEPGSVFTIVDYGCADGGTSMPLLYACVQELRKIHGDDLPIHVIYEDQPVNDFKALFLRLQGEGIFKSKNTIYYYHL